MTEDRTGRIEQLRRLTGRELEVLTLRASGRTIPEIAADLLITERTAHFHLGNIYVKLDLAALSQGQRQLELAAYDRLFAEVRERGDILAPAPEGAVDEPPSGAVLAVLEDEAAAGAPGGVPPAAGPITGGRAALAPGTLVKLKQQGVTAAYVVELAAEGYDALSPDALVELKQQGITGTFISDLRRVGLERLSPNDLIEARQQGVTARFVTELRDAGYHGLSFGQLVEARQQGVTGAFIRELATVGLTGLSLEDLVEARQQGVDAAFVRSMQSAGLPDLRLSRLVELRQQGVDAEYVAHLRGALGGRGAPG